MITPSPLKLIFISFLIWFFAFITIPAEYVELGDSVLFAIFTLVAFNLSFIAGLFTVKKASRPKKLISSSKKRQIIYFMFFLGFIGVSLRVYQRIFIQDLYFAENLVRQRMELLSTEMNSGLTGLISAVLYPFATISGLASILWIKSISKFKFIIIFLFGLFPIFDAFLSESRLVIILISGMYIITFLASNVKIIKSYKTIKLVSLKLFNIPSFLLQKKVLILASIVLIVVMGFFIKVVNNRLSTFGYKDTFFVWEIYHQSKIDKNFRKEVYSYDKLERNKAIAMYSIKHYFAHSVVEYTRLVSHLDKITGYYYGMNELYPYFKLLKFIGFPVPSFGELNKVSHKQGVYTTFWGSFYIDFGVFGIFISFFLGRYSKIKYLNSKIGSTTDIIIYSFLVVVILGSFFHNFVQGGNVYFINSIVFFVFLCKYWPNKLIFKNYVN